MWVPKEQMERKNNEPEQSCFFCISEVSEISSNQEWIFQLSSGNKMKALKRGGGRLKNLVVNDGVERGVAMISTFSYSLTAAENTKQVLLHPGGEARGAKNQKISR